MMRVRYKPWAEDYLKNHPDLVDMDGAHAGKMSEWFEKEQPIYIEIGSGMGQFITTLAAQYPEINSVLNFSDPWPKKRHAKRRLTYHTYLALYKQILKDDGEIHFKTDNRGLFAFSIESMSQFGMYFTKMNLNLHDEDDEDNIVTEYEKKFSEKGSRIYRMEAKFHKCFE